MFVVPPDNTPIDASFSDLLVRYPILLYWLAEQVQNIDEPTADILLMPFLAECSDQGIPENAYPFTDSAQGLNQLDLYLQRARWEIHSISERTTQHISATRPEQSIPPTNEVDSQPTSTAPDDLTAQTALSDESIALHADPTAQPTMPTPVVTDMALAEPVAETTVAIHTDNEPTDESIALHADLTAQPTMPTPVVIDMALAESVASIATDNESATFSDEFVAVHNDLTAQATMPTPVVTNIALAEPVAETTTPIHTDNEPARPLTKLRKVFSLRERVTSWTLLLTILAALLVPTIFLAGFSINAYTTYRSLSDEAHSAVNDMLNVKTIFTSNKSASDSSLFNAATLERGRQEFIASGEEFTQLQKQLSTSATLSTIATYLPQYRSTLTSAQAASEIGIDVARIGQIAMDHLIVIAPSLKGPLLASSTSPLITQSMLNTIGTTIDQVQPLLNDIQSRTPELIVASLPISDQEKAQIAQIIQILPQTIRDVNEARSLLNTVGWVLGVDQPRTFLVQTMDRAELRGSGGFTGQYGQLSISGGRLGTFNLQDISNLEYTQTSANQGQNAPAQYSSWWPFSNWGLRDSNVSADFPTTAQLALKLYQAETGNQADGLISFTPVVIEHVLSIIGPIHVPGYNNTVTAQNLEDLLHYYQLDNSGIGKQKVYQPDNNDTSARKRFTNYLSKLLIDDVRHAPLNELISIGHVVLNDLQARDLQVYFANTAAENSLIQHDYAGQMDRSLTHDGLYAVQVNISASKASQYVQTTQQDTVTLDSSGGATHHLQLRLTYNQAGPVYGYDTYYDYLRVYVPPNSQLLSGDGFSTGTPLCGGSYGSCPDNGPYKNDELVCPSGQYQPGGFPPSTLYNSDGAGWQPLQTLGGPTSTTSDEPDRAMFGGLLMVPKNCTLNVTLSWYVPAMSSQPYSLLVQRQAGTFPELNLTIQPSSGDCSQLHTTGLYFDGTMTRDMSFTPAVSHPASTTQNCYPHPAV